MLMNSLPTFLARLRAVFTKPALDADFNAELTQHLEAATADNIRAGMTPDEARRQARIALGGVEQTRELHRDARGLPWLEDLARDVRYALRQLARAPGFTAVTVLSLALGIGAGTAIFSLLNAVRLRALPVPAPHELRVVSWTGINVEMNGYTGDGLSFSRGGLSVGSSFPYPAYREFREHGLDSVAAFAVFPLPRVTALARGEATIADGLMVSGNFFSVYGALPFLGRPLVPEDDRAGAAPVAVITYGMWERQFGLDPHAVGQAVSLKQHAFTIVGVLPKDYVGPLLGDSAEFYVTFAAQPALEPDRPLNSADNWWVQIMARVPRRIDERQVQTAFSLRFQQVLATSTTKIGQPSILLQDGARGAGLTLRNRIAQPLLALLVVVGLVLMISCANVAGLLLARGAARRHEFATRIALGATRGRLVRQALTESLLLGLAAAGGGLLFAHWGVTALLGSIGAMPENFRFDVSLDANVLGFTFGVSVLTALVFGLLPALRASRVDPLAGLQNRAIGAPRLRLGKLLVAVQVGVSVLLVVVAGLMIRTFANLVHVDPGFDPGNLLLFRIDPGQAGVSGPALATFYADARRSLAAIPGVRAVAASSLALADDSVEGTSIEIPGRPAPSGESRQTSLLVVSDGFLGTMGIPLLLGRDLAASDTAASTPVAVVNETFVRAFFPDEYPLGRTIVLHGGVDSTVTIVGIARDAKYASIRAAAPPLAYLPRSQQERGAMVFAIRSALRPLSLVPAARKAIAELNPNLPLTAVRTQADLVRQSVALDRLFAGLCGGMAGLALLLACIGLYGLLAYNVARRTGEIGVRLTLGATPREIAWPVVREALWLAAAGLAAGLPAALGLARLARSQLYEVSPTDPFTLVGGLGLILAVATAAAWLPARRAAKVDPVVALRAE
jgi:predicted permease